jgi:hypothetical protein
MVNNSRGTHQAVFSVGVCGAFFGAHRTLQKEDYRVADVEVIYSTSTIAQYIVRGDVKKTKFPGL